MYRGVGVRPLLLSRQQGPVRDLPADCSDLHSYVYASCPPGRVKRAARGLQLSGNWTLDATARRIALAIGSYSGLLLTTVFAVVFCEQAYKASGSSVRARMRFCWSGAFRHAELTERWFAIHLRVHHRHHRTECCSSL